MDYKKKIELIRELVKDWGNEKINSYSAMIALSMIVNPKEQSRESIEWAMSAFIAHHNKEKSEEFDDWSEENEHEN